MKLMLQQRSLIVQACGTFIFDAAPSGSYYLEITHRNSLETWSGLPQAAVTGGNYAYDFTTSASQAFGDNMTHYIWKIL